MPSFSKKVKISTTSSLWTIIPSFCAKNFRPNPILHIKTNVLGIVFIYITEPDRYLRVVLFACNFVRWLHTWRSGAGLAQVVRRLVRLLHPKILDNHQVFAIFFYQTLPNKENHGYIGYCNESKCIEVPLRVYNEIVNAECSFRTGRCSGKRAVCHPPFCQQWKLMMVNPPPIIWIFV